MSLSITRKLQVMNWKKIGGIRKREYLMILSIAGPAVVYYLLLRYLPVLQTIGLSMTDSKLIDPEYQFVGFQNFSTIFQNQVFVRSIINTTYYAIVSTLLGTALALILAFILNPLPYGNNSLRLLFFLPQITSAIAISTIWLWLLQARFGLINQFLMLLGGMPIPWLASPKTALNSLIMMGLWGGVGYSAIIFVAGIRGIPKDFFDAARIDGASPLQMEWFITLPLLKRVITFVMVTSLIGSFQIFQQVYLMTHGGPLNSTRTISLMIFDTAFSKLRMGEAASMACVLFIIVSVFTVVQLRLQRTETEL